MIDAYRQSQRSNGFTVENVDGDDCLEAKDIVVRKFNINMGMKLRNPLECVSFYKEEDGIYKRV